MPVLFEEVVPVLFEEVVPVSFEGKGKSKSIRDGVS